MRYDLDITGDKRVSRRLARMSRRARQTRPLFEGIVDELVEGERRHWRSGAGWRGKPLAASTKARKRRQGLPSKPMRETRTLERFLTRKRHPADEGGRQIITRNQVRFGIPAGRHDAFHGRFHQLGKGVPQRKVVVLIRQTKRKIADVARRRLTS